MATANQKGKQPMNSIQVTATKDDHIDGELLAIFAGDSKPYEECVLDDGCTFHVSQSGLVFNI